MSEDISLFPGILGVLAHAGFVDDARKLADAWGGIKHYIPAHPKVSSRICKVISLDAAKVTAELYGGQSHDIPRMRASVGPLSDVKRRLRLLDHLPTTKAAIEAGCSARYVRMVRRQWQGNIG